MPPPPPDGRHPRATAHRARTCAGTVPSDHAPLPARSSPRPTGSPSTQRRLPWPSPALDLHACAPRRRSARPWPGRYGRSGGHDTTVATSDRPDTGATMGNELSTRAMQTLDSARQAILGQRVFGEANQIGDVTVIPVSIVRGGGGVGGGEGQGPNDVFGDRGHNPAGFRRRRRFRDQRPPGRGVRREGRRGRVAARGQPHGGGARRTGRRRGRLARRSARSSASASTPPRSSAPPSLPPNARLSLLHPTRCVVRRPLAPFSDATSR